VIKIITEQTVVNNENDKKKGRFYLIILKVRTKVITLTKKQNQLYLSKLYNFFIINSHIRI